MKQNRIAFIIGSMGCGGAERVVSILANDYAQNGWNVDILLLLSNERAYELHENINVVDLSGDIVSRWRRLPMWLSGIRKYVQKNKPDVVVSFVARINIIAKLSLLNIDVPLIVSERNDPYMDGRGMLVKLLTKKFYPLVSAVVFQTKRAQGYFQQLTNSVIISNPIGVYATKSDVAKKRIVTVGRLSEQKNQKMLIEAFSKVHMKYPEYTLDIYGEGTLRGMLQETIQNLGLSNCVTLKGAVKNVHQQISDVELFVLSSDYEGLSNALLEAMMMGIPCISTNCAGSDEYIKSGVNGMLTDVGNVDEIVATIDYMLSHSHEADRMGEQAKTDAQIFAKSNIIACWRETIAKSIKL